MKKAIKIGVVAGEKSGDDLGGRLIESIKSVNRDIQFFGVTGPSMERAGCCSLGSISELSVMGFIDVALNYIRLKRLQTRIVKSFLNLNIDLFIGIDAPSFNLRVSAQLKEKAKIKCAQFVAPQVWAWGQSRLASLHCKTDHIFTLFPFEEFYFKENGIQASFVGHPASLRVVKESKKDCRIQMGLRPEQPVIALFPGSRKKEIALHNKRFAEAALLYEKAMGKTVQKVVGVSSPEDIKLLSSLIKTENFQIIYDKTMKLLRSADVILAVSGTITLEAFLSTTPMVVAYRTSKLNYWILKKLIKIPQISLPNILCEERIVTELIQDEVSPINLANEALAWRLDSDRMTEFHDKSKHFNNILLPQNDIETAKVVISICKAR